MAFNICYQVCQFCYYLKYLVASTSYPQKKLISNTEILLPGVSTMQPCIGPPGENPYENVNNNQMLDTLAIS